MTNDELDVLLDNYVDEGLYMDVYDFKRRNDSILQYDIEDKLCNIKAKSLIIASTRTDGYFDPETDTLPLKDLIKGSEVLIFDSKMENYGDMEDYSTIGEAVLDFIEQFKQ